MALEQLPGTVVARVANAYGPGQPVARGQGVIAHWLRALRRDEPLKVYGDPGTVRDYIFAEDVADALVGIVDAIDPPRVLNIGSGTGTSLATLLHSLIRVADQDLVSVEYLANRSFDVPASYLDVALARTSIGWQAKVSLEEGLVRCWAAVSRFGDPLP
jgi:UDP-glucose 4-epimerase